MPDDKLFPSGELTFMKVLKYSFEISLEVLLNFMAVMVRNKNVLLEKGYEVAVRSRESMYSSFRSK